MLTIWQAIVVYHNQQRAPCAAVYQIQAQNLLYNIVVVLGKKIGCSPTVEAVRTCLPILDPGFVRSTPTLPSRQHISTLHHLLDTLKIEEAVGKSNSLFPPVREPARTREGGRFRRRR